jgi:uncharacterized damage-inducible protein DinB
MTLLDRLLGHDAWTTRQLLLASRPLTDAQLDHEFDLGYKSLRVTFGHILRNMEAWSDQIAGRPVRPRIEGTQTVDALLARLDGAANDLARAARAVEERGALDEPSEGEDPRSRGATILHVITHSMHHRAQVIAMLHRLGVPNVPEGDVLSWEQEIAR